MSETAHDDTYDPRLDYFSSDRSDRLLWAAHPFLARVRRRVHRLTRVWRALCARETTIAALEYALLHERLWRRGLQEELETLQWRHERLCAALTSAHFDEDEE